MKKPTGGGRPPYRPTTTGRVVGRSKAPRGFKEPGKPFTFLGFDTISEAGWKKTVSLLQLLQPEVKRTLEDYAKRRLTLPEKKHELSVLITLRLPHDIRHLEEFLAIASYRFGFDVTAASFPESALMRVLLPQEMAVNRKRDYATALKNYRREQSKAK